MKVFIVAGENSGDLHASKLMKSLLTLQPQVQFEYWGGEAMKSVFPNGIKRHLSTTNFMGFTEVVKRLPQIAALFSEIKQQISNFHPDVLVLVDYPGFNLRIAKWASQKGIKVLYYISPKVWAWNEKRLQPLKKYVDKLIIIFPFEKEYFDRKGVPSFYVGNPLMEDLPAVDSLQKNPKEIVLMPGSRRKEISRILPTMLEAVSSISDQYDITIAAMSQFETTLYQEHLDHLTIQANLVFDSPKEVLARASFGLVTSGTASLEAALYNVPQVVCYRTSRLNYAIGKRVITVPFISLVNLVLGREVVPELIQKNCTATNLKKALLQQIEAADKVKKDYDELREKLFLSEKASTLTAKYVLALVQ